MIKQDTQPSRIKEMVHKYMPGYIKRWIRNLLVDNKFLQENQRVKNLINRSPFDRVEQKFITKLFKHLNKNVSLLLEIREVRQLLARERLNTVLRGNGIQQINSASKNIHNTIEYNTEALLESVELDRPSIIINPLLSIEKIYKNVAKMKVLSIGPRSEIEIFSLYSRGFKLENIKAIDLISYSPYIDIGDMHDLPYEDNSFDIIIAGWVLIYSKDWYTFSKELMRCCRSGGVIAITADYSSASSANNDKFKNEATHIQSCDQILELFSSSIKKIYFRHDAEYPEIAMNMVIFELVKTLN